MTFIVRSVNERALVEITPDDSIKLPVGNFEYKVDGCLFYIHVIHNGEKHHKLCRASLTNFMQTL